MTFKCKREMFLSPEDAVVLFHFLVLLFDLIVSEYVPFSQTIKS